MHLMRVSRLVGHHFFGGKLEYTWVALNTACRCLLLVGEADELHSTLSLRPQSTGGLTKTLTRPPTTLPLEPLHQWEESRPSHSLDLTLVNTKPGSPTTAPATWRIEAYSSTPS
ncbi:hypothetical protein FOXYSP1_13563 [Fusarium oxysporum f. sp. phaseoli]